MTSRVGALTNGVVAAAAALAIALGGCGAAPPTPAPVAVVAPPPPPPVAPKPACIVADDAPGISHGTGDETHVQFCIGKTTDQCFALDLGSGTLTRLGAAPPEPATPTARIETTNPELKVCAGDACKVLTPKILPGSSPIHAATNADGTVAVVLLGDAAHGKGYAEIWDVTAGKKLNTFKYAQGEYRCGDVHMLGNTIYISATACAGPAARGQLFNLKGKRIAPIGGREFGTYGDAVVDLGGNTWAFLAENGNRIALHDVIKGKAGKPIDLGALWRKDGEAASSDAFGNPGESALIKLGDGKLGVIAGSPMNGSVAVIDIATGTIKVTRAALCTGAAAN